jgi:ribosomal protein S27AE
MSQYLEHAPCPECGSRDNLAIYTDHEYCFGCGYINFYNYHNRRILGTKDTTERIVSLPDDIVPYIPAIADAWVKKYDLTQRELYDNKVVWSDFRQLLIFPYFDDKGHLWGWQGRYFGDDPKHPKWTGKGNFKERIKVYGADLTTIVIVEDIVSCLKVSRIMGAFPLFGSYIDLNKICQINVTYNPKHFILWLDKDKMKESYLYGNSLSKLGINNKVISTFQDPKEFSTSELKAILNNN